MTTPRLAPDNAAPIQPHEPVALAPSMVIAVSRAHAFAPASTPIILHGESGCGKTFFAEYIHELSGRIGGFHAFSVGMVAPQLALDELYGHVQGAYTDARRMRTGRIAAAGSGTLLLDDLHTLDLGVQKQLLQVLDRGTYSPVGSDRVQSVACRVILAMTDDPDALMRKGLLLKDLRYRFGTCAIVVPPLRERRREIPILAERALRRCPATTGVDGPRKFSDASMAVLCEAYYEGNVRQLEGLVLSAYLLARHHGSATIEVAHLPGSFSPVPQFRRRGDIAANRLAVEQTLRITGGNVKRAAQLLGVSRTTVNAARKQQPPGIADTP